MLFTFASLVFTCSFLFSQDCIVEKDSLKGTYTGDCKKGKADGHGKALGTDIYEGEFKSGLPSGEGTYIWYNGNVYKGKFEKGLKNGNGVMTYKRSNRSDSVVEGFWKRDAYVGRYEKQFRIIYKSRKITSVIVKHKEDLPYQVTFWIGSTTGGTYTISQGYIEKPTISDILVTRGSYITNPSGATYSRKTETILRDVLYPFQIKVNIGSESLEIELFEEGSYVIDIQING